MRDRRRALKRAIWESDLIGSRFTLALGEFFWAMMLLWPGDSFSRPTYEHMSRVMGEEAWGVMFLISSIIQISIVLSSKMNSTFAWYFAGWNFCFWGYTVWSMLASVYPPPAAIGGEIAMALSAGWIWLRPIILSESDCNK
jgi:hypothetical protein